MGETRKRAAILAAASRLFSEKGFENTPTSEIARSAGVAEGTIYHHFDSKDGIFLTIFNDTADGYLAGMAALVGREKTGEETLRELIRFHFSYMEKHQEQFVIILRDIPVHIARAKSAPAAAGRKKFALVTALLTEALERGAKDETLRLRYPARDTAEMIRGILSGTTRHRMLGIIDVPLPDLAAMVEDFLQHALSPAHPESDSKRQGGGNP